MQEGCNGTGFECEALIWAEPFLPVSVLEPRVKTKLSPFNAQAVRSFSPPELIFFSLSNFQLPPSSCSASLRPAPPPPLKLKQACWHRYSLPRIPCCISLNQQREPAVSHFSYSLHIYYGVKSNALWVTAPLVQKCRAAHWLDVGSAVPPLPR